MVRTMTNVWTSTLALLAVLMGCNGAVPFPTAEEAATDGTEPGFAEVASPWLCRVDQPYPYPDGIPYVAIHGGPGHSDYIPCDTAPSFEQRWHALKGHGIVQPNTFSPDGLVTYAATTNPEPGSCTIHAVSVSDGQTLWCRHFPDVLESAVEVDRDGMLYFSSAESIVALTAQGELRWQRELGDRGGAIGLHFTPDGHIATVTDSGVVLLLARENGDILSSLSIQDVYGFVPPASLDSQISLDSLFPPQILQDFGSLQHGDAVAFLDTFAGAGGAFSSNTLAVSPRGNLYVVGGGHDPDHGSLVQILVTGTAQSPTLSPGWSMPTVGASASSPAISPDGHTLKVADGNSAMAILNPEEADAHMRLVDIEACDANTDGDPSPNVCAPFQVIPLASGPIMGATPMCDGGIHYNYETQISELMATGQADIRAFEGDTLLWEVELPDQLAWTSVITVTRNHLVGTATRFNASDRSLLTVEFPSTADSELVVLSRTDGAVVFRASVTDDSSATVTVGPDGSLYVTLLSLLHSMALDTRPVGGLVRFSPQSVRSQESTATAPEGTVEPGETTNPPADSDPQPDAPRTEPPPSQPVEPESDDEETSGSDPQPSDTKAMCIDVDWSDAPECCADDAAHCVPAEAIGESFQGLVGACGDGGLCVPDTFLEASGSIELAPCKSALGADGACLSRCIPQVAEQAAFLPQDVCDAGQLCVPCINPLTGEDLGVCDPISCAPKASSPNGGEDGTSSDPSVPGEDDPQSTDNATDSNEDTSPMTSEPYPPPGCESFDDPNCDPPPSCCAGWGSCIEEGPIPNGHDVKVKSCKAEGHAELMCVPNELFDASWSPQLCSGTDLLGTSYEGVCLPDCLKLPLEFTLDAGACPESFSCAKCKGPLGGDTGAPGCP